MKRQLLVFIFFLLSLSVEAQDHFSERRLWTHAGVNTQFLFGGPGDTQAKSDFSAFLSLRLDQPLGTPALQLSPEVYYLGKGDYIPYPGTRPEPAYGALNVSALGLALPLGLNFANDWGSGIRVSGGVFGELNYSPRFKDAENSSVELEFYRKRDRYDYGWLTSLHIFWGGNYEIKASYIHGIDAKTFIANDPQNTVNGIWSGQFRYIVIGVGASF